MISNFFIDSVLRPLCSHYQSTFASDMIPRSLTNVRHFSLVTNLSKHGFPGSHWCTVIRNDQDIFYIDPLGLPCISEDIQDFLDCFKGLNVMQNRQQIQAFDSQYCAFYCVFLALLYEAIFQDLDVGEFSFHQDNLKLNDALVVDYIVHLINKLN